jgi:hypothetical protein
LRLKARWRARLSTIDCAIVQDQTAASAENKWMTVWNAALAGCPDDCVTVQLRPSQWRYFQGHQHHQPQPQASRRPASCLTPTTPQHTAPGSTELLVLLVLLLPSLL